MLECLIWVALYIAVAIVVIWAIEQLLGIAGFPVPAKLRAVLTVIAVLVVLLYVLQCFGGIAPPWRRP